jgi:putative PIN family toxin of toxin-antitoxin system
MLVVDTNVVLDLWVFLDPGSGKIAAATQSPAWRWIGSQPMRDELALVLDYPHIAARLQRNGRTRLQVLVQYDALVLQVENAPRASAICKDPDDQKFIDLAAQHGAVLVSKDKAVLALNKRLNKLGAEALTAAAFPA